MSTDSHQGGRLEDMAEKGTSIPGDAGEQRTIPSVPRPDQIDPSPAYSHPNPAHATDNAFDIPRGTGDRGVTGEVFTATGHHLPTSVEKKNLDDAGLYPQAKGSDQDAKHSKKGDSFEKMAKADHGVEPAPGEEELGGNDLLNKRGAQ